MPSSACSASHRDLHSFPTRRSSDLIANPGGVICDIEAISKIAKRAGVPLIVDNTLATPYLCKPIDYGADVVVHSLTKFLGGHGNSIDRKSTRLNSSHLGISYAVFCLLRLPPRPTLFPYTTLFRSDRQPGRRDLRHRGDFQDRQARRRAAHRRQHPGHALPVQADRLRRRCRRALIDQISRRPRQLDRSEEHTSELQSLRHLVCRLLLAPPPTETYTLSLHDALPI